MTAPLPDYYFRIRENGALVFRVAAETRQRRIEMEPIAILNLRNGEIKPQGDRILGRADIDAIEGWIAQRRETVAHREIDDILRAVDHLNLTSQWAQARATPDQLQAVTEPLLMAMLDLRSVLVRRRSEGLDRPD